jgi:hypothetical protein
MPSFWPYWNYGIFRSFWLNHRPVLAYQSASVQKIGFPLQKHTYSTSSFSWSWRKTGLQQDIEIHKRSPSVTKSHYCSQRYCCKVEAIGQFVWSGKTGYPVSTCQMIPFYSETSDFNKHGFLRTPVNKRQWNRASNTANEPLYRTVRNFWMSSAHSEVQRPSNGHK